jgi:hypothetical protein
MRLGLRRLVYGARDARAFYPMPKPADRATPSEPLGSPKDGRETQARTAAGPANAVRLALRCPTHSEPDADAFHQMPPAAAGFKSENGAASWQQDARRRRQPAREDDRHRIGHSCPPPPDFEECAAEGDGDVTFQVISLRHDDPFRDPPFTSMRFRPVKAA